MTSAYFISPHLDDAFFSCGGLMLRLLQKGVDVTVVNVFTSAGYAPETLSAKAFLKQIKVPNSADLYEQRIAEDKEVLTAAGVKIINLDETEALWRKKTSTNYFERMFGSILPEFTHIYPTYRFHITSGKISAADSDLITRLTKKINSLVEQSSKSVVFCPMGIGGHVDHLVVKQACQNSNRKVLYWADIPYVVRKTDTSSLPELHEFSSIEITNKKILKKKEELAKGYVSQYKPVFENHECSQISEKIYGVEKNLQWLTV